MECALDLIVRGCCRSKYQIRRKTFAIFPLLPENLLMRFQVWIASALLLLLYCFFNSDVIWHIFCQINERVIVVYRPAEKHRLYTTWEWQYVLLRCSINGVTKKIGHRKLDTFSQYNPTVGSSSNVAKQCPYIQLLQFKKYSLLKNCPCCAPIHF